MESNNIKFTTYLEEYREITEAKIKLIQDWKRKQLDSSEMREIFDASLKEK
jgi:hypothetical protein